MRQNGHGFKRHLGGHLAGLEHVGQMADQPEARNIRGRAHSNFERCSGRTIVQRRHGSHCFGHPRLQQRVTLQCSGQDSGSERLGEHQQVAGTGAGIREHAVGMHFSDDGHPERRLDRIDGMAAQLETVRARGHLGGSPQDLTQHVKRHTVPRPADQVQGEQRRGPHRVDVAEGICGRYGSPGRRIVDDRREEIHGRHQSAVGRQPEHRRVISRSGVDKDPRVLDARQKAQDLRQFGSAELTRSTSAV
jgi:hypothetical protein